MINNIKNAAVLCTLFIVIASNVWGQVKNQDLNLTNVLVVAQQDDLSDRYSLEVALLQLFNYYDIKSKASLNIIKEGGSPDILVSDSIQQQLKEEGIDTYLLVSVRGYDNRFKPSERISSLDEELKAGHLFPLYRESASRVTFTFTFYRDLEPVYSTLIRTGTVGSKEAVLKKLMKKVEKELSRKWM
ncbi:MAG TPA: hypothetical protein VKX31_00145 [Brumimicrobium sp.]|nr:hypothetical protein [Brumimicrobium sp.]